MTGEASVLIGMLHLSAVMMRYLRAKVKPLIYWSVYVPTLTYDHRLQVVTGSIRL